MNFISGDFHLHYLASYTLYIKSGFQSDYLLVISNSGDVLVFLQYNNINPCVEAKRILALPFTKVLVNVPQQDLIWVPSDVYNESDKELYEAYFLDEDANKILTKEFKVLNAVALFQFDPLIISRWIKLYPEATFIPSFELLVNQCNKLEISKSEDILAIHIYDNQADFLVFLNGEFKLYNTYEINTIDDLSYYVLSVMKNFSLAGLFDKILLAGINANNEYVGRLNLYADQIMVLDPLVKFNYENEALRKVLLNVNLLVDTALCE